MISNPCNWFKNGNETVEFTYEGGKHFYHFSSKDSDVSHYYDFNIVFFADSETHALTVIKRMLELALATHIEHDKQDNRYHEEITTMNTRTIKEIKKYLEDLSLGKFKISLAPTNQVFKVGWAWNDTIL